MHMSNLQIGTELGTPNAACDSCDFAGSSVCLVANRSCMRAVQPTHFPIAKLIHMYNEVRRIRNILTSMLASSMACRPSCHTEPRFKKKKNKKKTLQLACAYPYLVQSRTSSLHGFALYLLLQCTGVYSKLQGMF